MPNRIFGKCNLSQVPAIPNLYEILKPKKYKEPDRKQRKGFRKCNYCSSIVDKRTMFKGSKNYYLCIPCAKSKSKIYKRQLNENNCIPG